jgi:pimeloyl-ACP methyl ester carboxylesterase
MDDVEILVELTENILERNGCPIHYWTGGKTGAPLVVFTHGATIDHREWAATLPLVGEHFRSLAWDMRGHGLSRPAIFHLEQAVADLLAVLDKLEVREAIFVGHSMGGNLHQEFAFLHPERVKALVMLDCTWNFMQLSASDRFWLKAAGPIFKLYPYKTLIDQSVAVSATSKESQQVLRKSMQILSKTEYVQVLMDATQCLRYDPGYRITQPLLLMMGDKEATGNIRKAMPLWALHEGVDLVVIPNAKHCANLDQPEIFHRHLLEFLQRFLKY